MRKKQTNVIIKAGGVGFLLLSLIWFGLQAVYAEDVPFSETHWSTRSAAIGNASTGLILGTKNVWFNPASTFVIEPPEGMYTIMVPHISRKDVPHYTGQAIGFAQPANRFLTLGLGWNNLNVKDAFQENTFLLNSSLNLTSFIPNLIGQLGIGINLKGLFYTVSQSGEDFFDAISDSDQRKTAFGIDAGLLYHPIDALSMGVAVINANRPPLNSSKNWPRVPLSIRAGAAYSLPLHSSFNSIGLKKFIPSVDVVQTKDAAMKDVTQTNFGTQIVFGKELFVFSGGVNSTEATAGISFGNMKTGQFSVALDYAFLYAYNQDIRDRKHMVSVHITHHPEKKEIPPEPKEERITPYRFGPGDVIQVITRNHEEFSGEFKVDPYGFILIPLIGEIKVEGYSKDELPEALKKEVAKYVEEPEVLVSIVQYRSKVIYVLGEVRVPGRYPIEGDSIPLRDAIAAAGLPTVLAATWRVYIITPSTFRPAYKIVNFYDILYRGKLANNVLLAPGDVVYVPMTLLGKLSTSVSYLFEPFFRARSIATPLATPRPLIDETAIDENNN